MSSPATRSAPPDQHERIRALDPGRSILVQAPAGSGKTDLLTRRFLKLLGEVDEPGQIVAITFTIAAAAEMRNRILSELDRVATRGASEPAADADENSMAALARRAFERSQRLGWSLLDTPSQLRISTIDSFCRELALQQPLLSQLGSAIAIHEQPAELYLRAARRTLERLDENGASANAAAELLQWRDNNWQELEELLVDMLAQRDRWMQDFVLESEQDWTALRERLERPFANALRDGLARVDSLLDHCSGARDEAHSLARFACDQTNGEKHRDLAEMMEFPRRRLDAAANLEETHSAYICLADLLLTGKAFRRRVDQRHGFPPDRKIEKNRILNLIANLSAVPGLEGALAAIPDLPAARYTDDEWRIVRACFMLLRHAAAELQVVFAEAGAADFIEVAQIAQRVLQADDGRPSDAAQAIADNIRHILVDEFQDTSRRQHELLRRLVGAWPEREGRTCFAVGDPMQSIYFFRDADAELFPRVRNAGLEIPGDEPLRFDGVALSANFRTAPELVERLNDSFERIFADPDGSGIEFAPALAAREEANHAASRFSLHLEFAPQAGPGARLDPDAARINEEAAAAQRGEIVDLIRGHWPRMAEASQARTRGEDAKYRVAVLGRARKSLVLIAQALREAAIPFRAVELEKLGEQPEVLDALSLARALLNPEDRVAWLGVLRAPWCGLSLEDLHKLSSEDNPELLKQTLPELLAARPHLLSRDGQEAVARVLHAVNSVPTLRAAMPNASLGTWLEQVWLRLGGANCVDAAARENVELLWSLFDRLPNGEQDLLGPSLETALKNLTAQPDPAAKSSCGVQLMTIHKAKGLEFEVVIVPELQALCGGSEHKLLTWVERGLAEPDASEAITEFLIAPLQSKGAERGNAKAWVDRIRRERERQEDRRILYVAATRAREELHLFARPAYKMERDGNLTLCEPKGSLLATGWPAFEAQVRAEFDEWLAAREAGAPQSDEAIALAASAATNLVQMPASVSETRRGTRLRRLPAGYRPEQMQPLTDARACRTTMEIDGSRLYERHEGGRLSRAFGIAVHRYLEMLARLHANSDLPAVRAALSQSANSVASHLRGLGIEDGEARAIAARALDVSLKASHDAIGEWIFAPHRDAESEVRWVAVMDGAIHSVQIDRVFRAGPAPGAEGDAFWWIVDYKTAFEKVADTDSALPRLRELFAPQLNAYAAVLRNLHGDEVEIRAGLYYPRMLMFDWWEA